MSGGIDWRAIRRDLEARDRASLDGAALDWLADACFWTDDVDASIEHRRAAYRAHASAADDIAAGMATWRLFYDHFLVGEVAVANGWRERGRRHQHDPASALAGWLALADADTAPDAGAAREHAEAAWRIAISENDPNLNAMALVAVGRAGIRAGDRVDGLARLDEAMVAVINDELDPLFTGWVFCNVIGTCWAIADIERAAEWNDAAMRWCATLRDGHLYPGLCRVYRAEVASLRGDWKDAADDVERACGDLERFDPRYAADAHHLRGELARRRGRLDEAAGAFERSRALGGDPLPGAALLDAAEGREAAALAALRSAAADPTAAPLKQVLCLRALVEVALQMGDVDTAAVATEQIQVIATEQTSRLIDAHASAAVAASLPRGGSDRESALRAAVSAFDSLGAPFEATHVRQTLADHLATGGDPAGAAHERELADRALAALGVVTTPPQGVTAVLSPREREVLRLVADGMTNPEIAQQLTISRHTVNRHVSNIMAKLGVSTRTAASARAIADRLL